MIHNVSSSLKQDCREILTYNISIMSLFAFSVVVTVSYICCSNCISTLLYILNATALTSMAIDRYVRKKTICDYEKQLKSLNEVKEEENKFGMLKAKDQEISNLNKEI